MSAPIRSPHDPALPTGLTDLVERYWEVRMASFDARYRSADPNPDALFTELAIGARIAREATAGRWCVVADLLRAGAAGSWAQVGTALDMTETEARDGFALWIAGQRQLRATSVAGLTDAEAAELTALAEAVAW